MISKQTDRQTDRKTDRLTEHQVTDLSLCQGQHDRHQEHFRKEADHHGLGPRRSHCPDKMKKV